MEIDKGQNMNVLLHQDTAAPLKLASDVAQWPLAGLQRKIFLWPKSVFPIDHYERDVCKAGITSPGDRERNH